MTVCLWDALCAATGGGSKSAFSSEAAAVISADETQDRHWQRNGCLSVQWHMRATEHALGRDSALHGCSLRE